MTSNSKYDVVVIAGTMAIGTFLGVRSPGTAYVLLHHYMGEIAGAFRSWGLVRGRTGAISNAIASAAPDAISRLSADHERLADRAVFQSFGDSVQRTEGVSCVSRR